MFKARMKPGRCAGGGLMAGGRGQLQMVGLLWQAESTFGGAEFVGRIEL